MSTQQHPACRPASRPTMRFRTAAVSAFLLFATTVHALPAVSVRAVNLADTVAGRDLWRYDYSISGPLGSFESVNLLFSYSDYADLNILPTYDAVAISPLGSQPDAPLQSDGQVTVTALNPLATTPAKSLSVSFVLTPGKAAGPQTFQYLDANFNVLAQGVTAVVPEPESAWLLLAGLALLVPRATARQRRGRMH